MRALKKYDWIVEGKLHYCNVDCQDAHYRSVNKKEKPAPLL